MISSHHVHPHLKCQLCQILILRICTGYGFRSKVFPYFWPSISSSIRNSSSTEPDFDHFLLTLSVIKRPQVCGKLFHNDELIEGQKCRHSLDRNPFPVQTLPKLGEATSQNWGRYSPCSATMFVNLFFQFPERTDQ